VEGKRRRTTRIESDGEESGRVLSKGRHGTRISSPESVTNQFYAIYSCRAQTCNRTRPSPWPPTIPQNSKLIAHGLLLVDLYTWRITDFHARDRQPEGEQTPLHRHCVIELLTSNTLLPCRNVAVAPWDKFLEHDDERTENAFAKLRLYIHFPFAYQYPPEPYDAKLAEPSDGIRPSRPAFCVHVNRRV
jgi:hypothetical protein